ncbi:MAG TPA: 2Fe-2S iron-sulfur cluster-binding protein [Anaerolineae bacterium]|nr:2Fe-2S iron-sulfur cluster-binding protein [Anaerolineae bacterium]
MDQTVTLLIDDQAVTVPGGTTIHKAAKSIGLDVPTVCYHDHTTSNALCRVCVVDVEGQRLLQPGCIVQAADGMIVKTRSERVDRSRRTIIEMLGSAVDLSDAPEIQAMAAEYHADFNRFAGERREQPVIDDNPMFIRDYSKCILCWRCVQVCADDAQYAFAINFEGRGFDTSIGTFFDKPMPETTCVFCGQCVGVCPTGALKSKREYLLEQGNTPDQIIAMTVMQRKRKRKG